MSINRRLDKDDVIHIYYGILLSHKKGWNNSTYSNMDGPRDNHTKWRKSDRRRQTSCIASMWNIRKNYTNEHIYKTETDSQTYKTAALPYVKTRSFKIKAKTFTNLMSKPHPRMITSVPLGRNLGICTHLQSRVIAMCSQVLFIH